MGYKKKKIFIREFKKEVELNCESISRGRSDFPMHFYCEKCKNQSIGDDSGTIYDCNYCRLCFDDQKGKLKYEHVYCLNYEREE